MFTKSIILAVALAQLAAADTLLLWLGNKCTGADEGYTSPLPLGSCIEFGQAQSYILDKDDGNTYNLYSGGGCNQYVGQVALSGTCLDVGNEATGIINIGPQSKKRWIRGANAIGELEAREPAPAPAASTNVKRSPNGVVIQKRVEGDTYQCPNVPSGADYFFVVQQESATHTETFGSEDNTIRNDFDSSFNSAYQNPSGQTLTLTMQQGVIQDIQSQDIDSLVSSLEDFRGGQSSPLRFVIGLYTGQINHPNAGLIGVFDWNGL
ncbi:uncharacterized protein BXZ73DRAFT_78638 [Epithele typhae]|uniref:uncharacterized protein n=1 Tax=Epithele typhae TaxID=378194 RepID=UPI002008CB72|nr:uncharacterized protein BXZ73DRAFT_78638 [Epithele typhae]KAH9927197.1 hypothetical protein BXZ73DRAFT_78638 [Epithele typhae]